MLDFAIFIFIIFGFLIGLKRGFILQFIHLTGFFIAFVVAYHYYAILAPKLTLWVPYPNIGINSAFQMLFDSNNLEEAYYRAIAFVVIFFVVKVLLQIIGSMLDFVTNLPIIKPLNIWAGGMLGFLEVYMIAFLLLYIAALLPIEQIQLSLNDSILAKMIIEHTPFLSEQIERIWIEYMAA